MFVVFFHDAATPHYYMYCPPLSLHAALPICLQARASGSPVLEHQKVALERTTQALDQNRPGASRDLSSAMQRDPALLREAAAGRSGPMIEAMADRKSTRLNSSH